MGSVLSKTNEDNTNRVTNININCFNNINKDKDYKPLNQNKSKKGKAE